MRDIDTAEDGGDDGYAFFHEPSLDDGWSRFDGPNEADQKPKAGFKDLTRPQWRDPILKPDEERDLIRLAKAGDTKAKDRLFQSYHRKILKIASQYHGPPHNDLMAAGSLGFLEGIKGYNLRRNDCPLLITFAEPHIRNRMREEVKNWRKHGDSSDTRVDRWVYYHRNATAEEVVAAVGPILKRGLSLTKAQAAIDRANACWNGHEHYDTTERAFEDGKYIGPPLPNFHDIHRMYDCFSRYQLSPHFRLHEPLSKIVDELAAGAKSRAEKRLNEIGRRAYALELVEQKKKGASLPAQILSFIYTRKMVGLCPSLVFPRRTCGRGLCGSSVRRSQLVAVSRGGMN